MSQFQKDPPWARSSGGLSSNMASGFLQHGLLSQSGIAGSLYQQQHLPSLGGASSFGQQKLSQQLLQQQLVSQTNMADKQSQRVFTGFVTKLHDNFGFVDEDVFFQLALCKGGIPCVGDRVLVEAQYNSSMPFKWNATRVQLLSRGDNRSLNHHIAPMSISGGGGVSSIMLDSTAGRGSSRYSDRRRRSRSRGHDSRGGGRDTRGGSSRRQRGHSPTDSTSSSSRRRHGTPSTKSSSSRDVVTSRTDVSSSKRRGTRSRSPRSDRMQMSGGASSAMRSQARYMVQIPKIHLNFTWADVNHLRLRYTNMYIPSDFFRSEADWNIAFPMDKPFQIGMPAVFHIINRELDPPPSLMDPKYLNKSQLEPEDMDYSWSAKVMLLGCPSLDNLHHMSCALAEDPPEIRDAFQHPTRLISFLVGQKNKTEPMAIGGAWSRSLDGPDPGTNPRTLINTAIRTTRVLTGIDLTECTQWFRFLQIRYLRPEEVRHGRTIPQHLETVVIFVPDIWSRLSSRMTWDTLMKPAYEKDLERRIALLKDDGDAATNDDDDEKMKRSSSAEGIAKDSRLLGDKSEAAPSKDIDMVAEEEISEKKEYSSEGGGNKQGESEGATHWSKLDPCSLKVTELREELAARNADTKGLKANLISRLNALLEQEKIKEDKEEKEDLSEKKISVDDVEMIENDDKEQAKESEKEGEKEGNEKNEENVEKEAELSPKKLTPEEEAAEKRKSEREAAERLRQIEREEGILRRRMTLPDDPAIIVHPCSFAKNGRFDCAQISLSVLLDYRPSDNKEHSFELYLFAELFNEMLMRDFGFIIYRGLTVHAEKEKRRIAKEEAEKEAARKKREEEEEAARKKKAEEEEEAAAKKQEEEAVAASMKKEKEEANEEDEGEKQDNSEEPVVNGDIELDGKESVAEDDEKSTEKSEAQPSSPDRRKSSSTTAAADISRDSSPPAKRPRRHDEDGGDSVSGGGDGSSISRSRSSQRHHSRDDRRRRDRSSRRRSRSPRSGDDADKSSSSLFEGKNQHESMETIDRALLLACVYFDQTHTDYISDRDVEEIIHILGLGLSRSQIRKLLIYSIINQQFRYRSLTDGPTKKKEEAVVKGGVEIEEEENATTDETKADEKEEEVKKEMGEGGRSDGQDGDVENLMLDDEILCQGNNIWLKEIVGKEESKPLIHGKSSNVAQSDGIVEYQGAILDIGSLLLRLGNSEKSQMIADTKIKELDTTLTGKTPGGPTWLQGRIALSQSACRFELPMDMRKLETMTVPDYLRKYTIITSRRKSLYTKVFNKHKDKSKGLLPQKILVKTICEVLVNTVTPDQCEFLTTLVGITPETNIDIELFSGMCALAERILYPRFVTEDTADRTDHQKERIERADFFALRWKLHGIKLNSSIEKMLTAISDYDNITPPDTNELSNERLTTKSSTEFNIAINDATIAEEAEEEDNVNMSSSAQQQTTTTTDNTTNENAVKNEQQHADAENKVENNNDKAADHEKENMAP